MVAWEKILGVLKVVGEIASTLLSSMEEYRKIQECKTYKENERNGVKYLPSPKRNKKYHRRRRKDY